MLKLDALIEKFERLKMAQNNNNNLTADLVAQLIATQTRALQDQITQLKDQLTSSTSTVTEFKPTEINESISCSETFDVIKSVPEFTGNFNHYVSWREAACGAMRMYKDGSRKYVGALTILRNKVTGKANDTLTNHGTVLNLEAILARLDFAYSDRRPIYIIEQELSVLRQGKMSVLEYYNLVNKKLTLLINKTIMTYGDDVKVISEMNKKNRDNALRIFITGLNGSLADILFSLKPENLPHALAKAQELEANYQRANFAYHHFSNNMQNTNTTQNTNSNFKNQQKKAEVPNNNNKYDNTNNLRFNQVPVNPNQHFNRNNQTVPEPMEIDPSIQIQNRPSYQGNAQANKRDHSVSMQQPNKVMRVNNIQEDHFLDQEGDISHTSTE